MAKKGRRSAGRVSLKGLSMDALQAEIERRRHASGPLMRKRAKLLRQLDAVNAQLGLGSDSSGGASPRGGRGPGRKRAQNSMSLVEALQKTLRGTTLGVTEAGDAVRRAGYKTTSPNFRTIVNQALIKYPKLFKKVSRGQYTAA